MYLKTLTLRGFKSFASATSLQFEPGVTCIVGPNGSGKSNVVDALAWVMGEQGAKTLRGGKMEDVIFAGTSERAPLGRAEVSLTIDNSDGGLPIDYAEVTISRTLFRNGGSEYAINGTPCRLLDVQELLSDTGMGRQMHVIVGQGQLDTILRATPEERRGFIEESAGVLKHRKRKEKALRKLDSMAANLTRLQDLTAEIRRQLGPLAKQAQVARRASVIQAELRDAQARILADDLAQVMASHVQQLDIVEDIAVKQTQLTEQIETVNQQLKDAETHMTRSAPEADRAAETWYRLSALRERLRSLDSLADQRVTLLSSMPAPAVGIDPDELTAQAQRTRHAEQELREEVSAAEATLGTATGFTAAAEEKLAEISSRITMLQRSIADHREGYARLLGQVEAHRGRVETRQQEIARIEADITQLAQEVEDNERNYRAVEMSVADIEAGEVDLDEAYEHAKTRYDERRSALEALQQELASAQQAFATTAARLEALELSTRRKDGAVALTGSELADLTIGTLASLIRIDHGYDAAVSAALGPLSDAIVVRRHEDAQVVLTWLQQTDQGRINLVVCDIDNSALDELPAGSSAQKLISYVTPAAEISDVVTRLLADVLVAANISEADQLLRQYPRHRIVTIGGDMLGPTHAAGGSMGAPSLVQLQAEYDLTAKRRDEIEVKIASLKQAYDDLKTQVDESEQEHNQALARLHESDAKISAVAQKLALIGDEIRRGRASLARLETQRKERIEQLATHQEALEDAQQRLVAIDDDPKHIDEEIKTALQQREAVEETVKQARSAQTEAQLVLRTNQERIKALHGKAEALERQAAAEHRRREEAQAAQAKRLHDMQVARDIKAKVKIVTERLEKSLVHAAKIRDEAQQARTQYEELVRQIRQRKEQLLQRSAKLADAAHQEELARTQRQALIDNVRQRAIDELGIDPDVLIDEYGPHLMIPTRESDKPDAQMVERPYVRDEQIKRLKAAQRAMSVLGRVNPLAMEEHAALEERHTFLTKQLDDLKRSRADLLQIVKEVDERVEQVFAQAFADTQKQFDHVFARLFPGGHGRLVLTDPDDMLNTGIEVEARPAGKKVTRLSLLSGGERSLAAIALLVAIFKARPSPFYVMDEVEAALDDVNLTRLLGIFKELQQDSQLIVITHQKRTMEIADALYGVTMRGDGVTTVISQRLVE